MAGSGRDDMRRRTGREPGRRYMNTDRYDDEYRFDKLPVKPGDEQLDTEDRHQYHTGGKGRLFLDQHQRNAYCHT